MRAAATFSHHKSVIEAFVKKGHTVLALFDKTISKKFDNREELEKLKEELGSFDFDYVSSREDWWRNILLVTREILTYRNYLLMGEQSDFYRRDWIKFLPGRLRSLVQQKESFTNRVIRGRLIYWLLSFIEKVSPPDKGILATIKKYNPDAVLATPVNFRHSSADLEYLKATKWLGIPAVLPVYSWDNLTVRGLVHVIPDLVLAWNEVQAEEAAVGALVCWCQRLDVTIEMINGGLAGFKGALQADIGRHVTRQSFAGLCGGTGRCVVGCPRWTRVHLDEVEAGGGLLAHQARRGLG